LSENDFEEIDDFDFDEEPDRQRICDNSCPHFDGLNMCCWQAGEWGLCFDVEEGDLCHLDYLENDGR